MSTIAAIVIAVGLSVPALLLIGAVVGCFSRVGEQQAPSPSSETDHALGSS
jgi:hypothetical protein